MSETANQESRSPDPVANPVRWAIVRALGDRGDLEIDAIAQAAGVHRNTARAHCRALEASGVIERAPREASSGPGRPTTLYRLASTAQGPSELARLLGGAIADSGISDSRARALGRARGAALPALVPKRPPLAELEQQLRALGFRATVTPERVELEDCPCPQVSAEQPALVCALVAGTIDGALEKSGAPQRVTGGEHDPVARRCCLRLSAA